jgi:hypothetical protein
VIGPEGEVHGGPMVRSVTELVSTAAYVPNRRISMKGHPALTEKWVQGLVSDDPSLLGLGDLEVKDLERMQPRAGRLDMLLYDAESNTRYEVELQLGPTDESHIIRTIEYWDLEKKRYPQYDHVGVIVAEEITARFFNVISLFNGFIPLVAVQVAALEVGGALTLSFTTVLDPMIPAVDEEDGGGEPKDRAYWEQRASKETLSLTDRLLGIVQEVEPGAALKYNKNYIGLSRSGLATNFVTFRPRRHHVIFEAKIPSSEELTERLTEAGLDLLAYNARWGLYRMSITGEDLAANADLLGELVGAARDAYDA